MHENTFSETLGSASKGRRTEGMVFSPPPGTVTLHTYDDQFVVLPASAALHSKRLRNDFLEENGARRGGELGPIPLTTEPFRNCVRQTVQYAAAYLKMCDAMASLPGSGYSIEDEGANLVTVHLPSIYTYLGRGTPRLAWEQALCAYKTAISTQSDHCLIQLMYTAEALALRGMRDTVVVQIAIRIEKGSAGVVSVCVCMQLSRGAVQHPLAGRGTPSSGVTLTGC